MIPLLVAPLTDLTVWVTRPALQSNSLGERIRALGGEALLLPVLDIVPRAAAMPAHAHELLIFTSVNAVTHGLPVLQSQFELAATSGIKPLVAAVGASTAAALTQHGYRVDLVPDRANSEGLLAAALLQLPPPRVLIVRGIGGRELLQTTLTTRGSQVTLCEVYARAPATPDAVQTDAVVTRLRAGELDVISATSVDTLHALLALLDAADRQLARQATLLAGSARIAAQAAQLDWRGECVASASPDDQHLLGALVRWRMRARS